MFSPKTRQELKDAVDACLRLSDDCSIGPHGPIGTWDVSQVTNMRYMFQQAVAFNAPLNAWDVSRVSNMQEMFVDYRPKIEIVDGIEVKIAGPPELYKWSSGITLKGKRFYL